MGIAGSALPRGNVLVPVMLAVLGGALIWRQASEPERTRLRTLSLRSMTSGEGIGRARLVLGAALVVSGGALVLARADVTAVRDGLLAVIVTLVGVALITGPWWMRLVTQLSAEREERVRSQARADIAAHLHDSVLQTLALIQRNADSPREVSRLARGQERELRHLLYESQQASGQFGELLRTSAAEIEDAYAISVEVVLVGEDAEVDEGLAATGAAAREALVNAAKHAGIESVSLFAEIEDEVVSVFVKDRGAGFVVDEVADDRQGVKGSIVARVERHGGTAAIRSAPGRGTEVELRMPRREVRRMTARVVLVDDHAMFRSGVRAELGARVEVVGEAGTVADAVEVIRRTRPDVVLLDVHMPEGGGAAVLATVRSVAPDTRFLALSVSDAAEDVIEIIRAGASGYVTKTISAGDLADAIDRVAGGDVVFSPRLAGFVLDAFRDAPVVPAVDPEVDQLTPREREVLRLLARGYAYKEIAVGAVHLDQDGRDARVERAAQAAAVQPAPADPLGRRPPDAVARSGSEMARRRAFLSRSR